MKLSVIMTLATLMAVLLSFTATTVSAGYIISYEKNEDAACRKDKGDSRDIRGYDGEDYELFTAVNGSFDDCKDECTSKSWCKGFEYYFTGGRCELWKDNYSGEEEEKEGFQCYWKVYK